MLVPTMLKAVYGLELLFAGEHKGTTLVQHYRSLVDRVLGKVPYYDTSLIKGVDNSPKWPFSECSRLRSAACAQGLVTTKREDIRDTKMGPEQFVQQVRGSTASSIRGQAEHSENHVLGSGYAAAGASNRTQRLKQPRCVE